MKGRDLWIGFFAGVIALGLFWLFAFEDRRGETPTLSAETKLLICQKKTFTTSEGIMLSPASKRGKDLWVIDYLNKNMKLGSVKGNE